MHRRIALLVTFLAACHEPPVPSPVPPKTGVSGEIIAPDGARGTGRLVITWRTTDEQRAIESQGMTLTAIRQMLGRMTASPTDLDLAATPRIPYAIPEAPSDAVPVAFFDVEHTFWETFQGGGKGFVGQGRAGGGPITLARNAVDERPPVERCAGERYSLVLVDDAQLGRRRFCAYLPASWKKESKTLYPVIFLFPGFGSRDTTYLTGKRNAQERFDAIASEMSREAVLVGVDTSTALGSTYLEDSPVTGAWDTFLATKALPTLERELHLAPRRTARAVMGQSTGGYNALSYGMRHSDLFSAIGASSPDAPNVEEWLLEPGTRRAREWLLRWTRIEAAVGGAGQMTSWAASWSPDPTARRGFRYPIDLASGVADERVLAQWVAKTPHGLLRDAAFRARVAKDLTGRIMIIVGRHDDFDLFAPAESIARELSASSVETRFVATEHGHANHLERFEPTFRFLLERLDPAK